MMNTAPHPSWSISADGLGEIQIALRTVNLRIFRADGPRIELTADDGSEPSEWLRMENDGRVLSVVQQRTPVRLTLNRRATDHTADESVHRQGGSPWPERSWSEEVHETVRSAMDEAFSAFDTAIDTIGDTFGESYFSTGTQEGGLRWTGGHERRAPNGERRQVTLSVGIPAVLEAPVFSARVDRGTIRAADLWGVLSLRSANGAIEMTRCGRDCTVHTGRGALSITSCEGRFSLHSGSGEVRLTDCQGTADVHTGKGAIRLERCHLQGRCHTGHGDLWLETIYGSGHYHTGAGKIMAINPQGDDLDLHSGMGEIVLEGGSARHLRIHSGKGALRCVNLHRVEDLDLHTGMGNITVEGGVVLRLNVKSGAGALECSTTLGRGEHELGTGAGNINVHLTDDAGVRIDAVTRMGSVHSDFGLVKVGRPGPATIGSGRFVGTVGDGDVVATLNVKTGAGNINILRIPLPALEPELTPAPGRAMTATAVDPSSVERTRLSILNSLQRGEITVEEAMLLLERLK